MDICLSLGNACATSKNGTGELFINNTENIIEVAKSKGWYWQRNAFTKSFMKMG